MKRLFVAGEIQHRIGDVVRFAHEFERNLPPPAFSSNTALSSDAALAVPSRIGVSTKVGCTELQRMFHVLLRAMQRQSTSTASTARRL